MNANYIGSFAEQNMVFRSAVDVVELVNNEPFHCISVYVPSDIAPSVIKDYATVANMLTSTKPLVFSCDVQNYADVMQGGLLTQMQPVYRGDSNIDVVVYVIVFYHENDGIDYWTWTSTTADYAPLTAAFEKLYFISYIKMLYDENMDGEDTENVPSIGKLGKQIFTLTNNTVTLRKEGTGSVLITNSDTAEADILGGVYEGEWTDSSSNVYTFNITIPTGGAKIAAGGSASFPVTTVPTSYLDPIRGIIPALSTVTSTQDLTMNASPAAPAIGWTQTALVTVILSNVNFQGQQAGLPQPVTLNAGKYLIPDSVSGSPYALNLTAPISIANGATSPNLTAVATVATNVPSVTFPAEFNSILGFASTINPYVDIALSPNVLSTNFTQGELPGPSVTVPSAYFDLALALAQVCKGNPTLSIFFSQVRVAVGDDGVFPNLPPVGNPSSPTAIASLIPTDSNKCKIRSASIAEETAGIASLSSDPTTRASFFWGALKLMQANNTFLVAHSEMPLNPLGQTPTVNILTQVLSEWYRAKNASGLYVGNKVHNIRLSGDQIKPFGWASSLNTTVNQNDTGYSFNDGQTMIGKYGVRGSLQPKGVAYLQTISDNSPEDCRLTYARTLDGVSINAQMIAKWVDYRNSMDAANLITDRGTLTNPVLTDQDAYSRIQSIVFDNLSKFTSTGRIVGIQLTFPSFSVAKVGLTALEAASAWNATYIDDLDKVTVSGGIVEL